MELIKKYQLTGSIVIADNDDAREMYAAKELRYYFQRMTGRAFVTHRIPEREENAVIVLGEALSLYGEVRETYDDDELYWYVKDNRIFIDGGIRGLLYGVYDFLEFLGCRFFTASCEKVPTYENLVIPETAHRDKPAFNYRLFYFGSILRDPVFAAKRRINGSGLPAEMGGSVPGGGCHTVSSQIPYAKHCKDHPDWFALVDGRRDHGATAPHGYQLCLSNPEVTEELIRVIREELRADPNRKQVCFSPNDTHDHCQCERCRAIDEEEGSPAGLLIRTLNAISDALSEEFPNVIFDTLAYTYTRKPPKITKPRSNVMVRLCTIESCFFHPMEDRCGFQHNPSTDNAFVDDFEGWSKICDRISIWDYVTSFHNYLFPHPNWKVLQPNMQYFFEHNTRGVFAQGNEYGPDGSDLEELRCYLITNLLWNPYCDFDELMREFTDFYYGAAAPFVREYIETVCSECAAKECHVSCYQRPDAPYLAEDSLDKYDEVLDRAEAAVQEHPLLRLRIQKIRLSTRYARLRRQLAMDHLHDAEALNRFISDCESLGVTFVQEGITKNRMLHALVGEQWRSWKLKGTKEVLS